MIKLNYKPLTKETWLDIVRLFGDRGACGGCWCMTWRLQKADFEKNKGAGNKKHLKKITENGMTPGLIGYHKQEPIAWCSFGPRDHFVRLQKSRLLKPIDEEEVWVVSCLFVSKPYRRMGVSVKMLRAVARFAKEKKKRILEAYPVVPYSARMPDVFAWTGLQSAYQQAGFVEVARPSRNRPIMRFFVMGKQ
ncbi:MAG: GNAT family N-acetyltransferase, partial [Bacteroidetes bacterium]|nr:GNAT family N-acetyltransferase [Bacteroidota bacterium]